ncbi:hypothetical protein HYT18_00460 [Candidatus Microgenomates bacterium]|nr:hypothetical protein [Candidatus Microgenomates bacterium]
MKKSLLFISTIAILSILIIVSFVYLQKKLSTSSSPTQTTPQSSFQPAPEASGAAEGGGEKPLPPSPEGAKR